VSDAKPIIAANAWLRWDVIRDHLRSTDPGCRILECGAGGGAVATRLAEIGDYWGVEPDPISRASANQRLGDSGSVVASLDDLPDESFDLLCAFEVLEHLPDDHGSLAEWVEWLRPGGDVLVSVPAHRHRFAAHDTRTGHLRRYDPADLEALLASAGLVDVAVRTVGFPLGYLLETGRNVLARRAVAEGAGADPLAETAGSGRYRQPSAWMGPVLEYGTLPSRLIQRAMPRSNLGTGLVGRARVPAS
jgi:SAM-dependent methyltransferase